jgi:ADP-ribosyl-[dinitrogen reductase] hydrolase
VEQGRGKGTISSLAIICSGAITSGVGDQDALSVCDRYAMSGEWDRDLALDLDEVRDWGAAAVVTLLEQKELVPIRVERVGEEILRRNMVWFHLPIVDVSIPDERFDEEWSIAGEKLRSILGCGSDCWSIAAEDLDEPAQ